MLSVPSTMAALDDLRQRILEREDRLWDESLQLDTRGWLLPVTTRPSATQPTASPTRRLCVVAALAWSELGKPDMSDRWLDTAASAPLPGPILDGLSSIESGVAMIRGLRLLTDGDIGQAIGVARRAVELEANSIPPWRAVSCIVLGGSLYWRGESSEARPLLEETVRVGHELGGRDRRDRGARLPRRHRTRRWRSPGGRATRPPRYRSRARNAKRRPRANDGAPHAGGGAGGPGSPRRGRDRDPARIGARSAQVGRTHTWLRPRRPCSRSPRPRRSGRGERTAARRASDARSVSRSRNCRLEARADREPAPPYPSAST